MWYRSVLARGEQDQLTMNWLAACFGLTILVSLVCLAEAQEPPTETDQSDQRLVVRISESFLDSLLDDEAVDRQTPVQENILGTSIVGTARVRARPGVKLVESSDKAMFYLTLTGTVHARSTGYHGPAIIHSRAVTTFTASKQIVLEPGKGFQSSPPVVRARTTTYVDGIGSVPGGLIGRIVRRRASQREAQDHNTVQEIARQRAEARIRAGFHRTSEERLAKLNQAPEFAALAALLKANGAGDWRYACCTTNDCLQIASFLDNGGKLGPIELPFAESTAHAPIEVWMHESIVDSRVAAEMEVVRSSANAAAPIIKSDGTPFVSIHHVQDWQRVDVSAKPKQLMSLASLMPESPQLRAKPIASEPANESAGKESAPSTPKKTAAMRTWTSGRYRADAKFVSLQGNLVRLQRSTGVGTSIELDKLSALDQEWIRHYLAK